MKAKQAGALLLIIVMVFSMLAAFFTSGPEPERSMKIKKEFNTVKDGLKLIPQTPVFVQFVNVDNITRTQLATLIKNIGSLPPFEQYHATVTRALIAEYSDKTWVELHEAGYKEIKPNYTESFPYGDIDILFNPSGVAIVSETSPIIFGYPERVQEVVDIMNASATNESAYQSFLPLLERSKYDANFALVRTGSPVIFDRYYLGLSYAERENNYHFNAVLHLNSSANATDIDAFRSNLTARGQYAQARNFTEYRVSFDAEYAMINATGNINAAWSEFQVFAR